MDPKAASALDPKLKEVYDRVMGVTTTGSKPQSVPPTPPTSSPTVPVMSAAPVQPQPSPVHQTAAPVTPQPTPGVQPAQPSSAHPPTAAKSAIDYASLAAKYATPMPSMTSPESSPRPAAVKPSTTAYGVVNAAPAGKTASTDKKRSSNTKKLLLLLGIPVFLIVYTVIWIVVFGVDITAFLPI